MLKRVTVTNFRGESMRYEIAEAMANISEDPNWVNPDEAGLLITSIDGLGPSKANININELTTTDGGFYSSAHLTSRNIVINGIFRHASSIEEARLLSYKYFPIKSKVTVKVETDNRTATTTGYVETNEPVIFSKECETQISILCESAFFDGESLSWSFANPSSVTPIVYEGDSDIGVEMTFELPTNSPVEKYKVTEIALNKNGSKIEEYDFSKMSGLVPNSAPSQLKTMYASFALNPNGYNFLKELPKYDSLDRHGYNSVICNNKIHLFGSEDTYSGQSKPHLTIDLDDYSLTELPDVEIDHTYNLITLNDEIYSCFSEDSYYQIYHYDQDENVFERVVIENLGNYKEINGYDGCIVYDNKIHIFFTTDSNAESPILITDSYHYTFDGTNFILLENLTEDYPSLFPKGSLHFTFSSSNYFVYGNKIHVIGGAPINDYNYSHYIWDGTTWSQLSNMPIDNRNANFIIYGGFVYILKGWSDGAYTELYLYNADFNSVTSMYTIPFLWYKTSKPLSDGAYLMFLVSNDSSSVTYTEEANNVKLIENDKLVVNTVKGKKSINLLRDGKSYNVLNIMEKDFEWLELSRGTNTLSYSSDGDQNNLKLTIKTNKLYEGV